MRSTSRAPTDEPTKMTGGIATMPIAPRELHGRWTLFKILEGKSNRQIRKELGESYLPCASDADLDARRRGHRSPAGFSLDLPLNHASRFFLGDRNLDRLAEGTADTRRAVTLLRSARLRELVESALLLGVPERAITNVAKALLETDLEPGDVQAFGGLLFRLEVVTQAQLRILVEERVRCSLGGLGTPATVERALACDGRMIAMSLPPGPSSWVKVLVALGFPSIPRSVEEMIVSSGLTYPGSVRWVGGPTVTRAG